MNQEKTFKEKDIDMKPRSITNNSSQIGAVFSEMLLVIPVLMFISFAAFMFGRILHSTSLVEAAAERAVSYGAVVSYLEDADPANLSEDEVVKDIKQQAVDYLTKAGVPVKLGLWQGGEGWKSNNNSEVPYQHFINSVELILPSDPTGENDLAQLLFEEPIIIEIESFVANPFAPGGYSRNLTRRASYREMSNSPSLAKDYTGQQACVGAMDSRYGYNDSNGLCYCRQGADTGLVSEGDKCECGIEGQSYNEETDQCECPPLPENAQYQEGTCNLSCKYRWSDMDQDGSCETCADPYTTDNPIASNGETGVCACPLNAQQSCHQNGGTYDVVACECAPCTEQGGTGAPDEYFKRDGSCECRLDAACPDSRMSIDHDDACRCKCPEFFEKVGDTCVCDTEILIAHCAETNQPITSTFTCTCGDACEEPFKVNETFGYCECPVEVDRNCPEGETFNEIICDCEPNCDGDIHVSECYCSPSVQENCAEGKVYYSTFCSCLDSCSEIDPNKPHYDPNGNNHISQCKCDKEQYLSENPGACDGKVWDQNVCSCVDNNCKGSTPDLDEETNSCFCDVEKRTAECFNKGESYDAEICSCGTCPSETPDLDEGTNTCICDADSRMPDCHAKDTPFDFDTCNCDSACTDPDSPDLDLANNKCYCDRSALINRCFEQGLPVETGHCWCKTTPCKSTQDLSSSTGNCECNKQKNIEKCVAEGKPVTSWNCDCRNSACNSNETFNTETGNCDCTSPPTCTGRQYKASGVCYCQNCPVNQVNDGNDRCVCTDEPCFGMQTRTSKSQGCACSCPDTYIVVNIGDGCKPGSNYNWFWDGTQWNVDSDRE